MPGVVMIIIMGRVPVVIGKSKYYRFRNSNCSSRLDYDRT